MGGAAVRSGDGVRRAERDDEEAGEVDWATGDSALGGSINKFLGVPDKWAVPHPVGSGTKTEADANDGARQPGGELRISESTAGMACFYRVPTLHTAVGGYLKMEEMG